ncbi:MAG: hypothetical protein ACE5HS_13920 [bacterium]
MFFLLLPAANFAQGLQELSVLVNNKALDGVAIRGVHAGYPYPVIFFVSVLDNQNNLIRGLAHTNFWLRPQESAQNGRLISQIWQPILEFRKNNPSLPLNPNLYDQKPAPQFIEICEDCEEIIPASTLLLMDMSSSINDPLLTRAKDGLRVFVEDMRPQDRTGVIQFAGVNGSIRTLPPTSDKDTLISFIDTARVDNWTPLYRSLMQGIEMIEKETSLRRSLVIYTDGRNALPDPEQETITPDTIISMAQKLDIPIFTIALGNFTNEKVLQRIATATGGLYVKTVEGLEFNDIYRKISDIIQNFYVMAYTAPESCVSDSIRILDITVNDLIGTGRGLGTYIFSGEPNYFDLAVSVNSDLDTTCAVEEFSYEIEITNLGPTTAFNFALQDTIPDFLIPFDFEPQPDSLKKNVAFWNLDSLGVAQETTFSYAVRVAKAISDSIVSFINKSHVQAQCDTNDFNDFAVDTVYFKPSKCFTDVSVNKFSRTSRFQIQNSDTLWFAERGETFPYFITVQNGNEFEAKNVVLTDFLPELVKIAGHAFGDTVTWNLGDLPALYDTTMIFTATVASNAPQGLNRLVNTVQVEIDNEASSDLANNTATNTVYHTRLADVSVTTVIKADSFFVSQDDTLWFAEAGKPYITAIKVKNEDDLPARNVVVLNALPDSVRVARSAQGDIVQLILGDLRPFADTTIVLQTHVSPFMPEGLNTLINSVTVRAENEDPEKQQNNFAVDTLFNYVEPVIIDVSITASAKTDSFVVQNSDTLWFASTGEIFNFHLQVKNETKFPAENVVVTDFLPDSVQTLVGSSGDSVQFRIQQLAPFADTTLILPARVVEKMPEGRNLLVNTVTIQADNEQPDKLTNNTAIDTFFNYVEPVIIDISVSARVQTDSFVVQNSDTLWFVKAGAGYTYLITVKNENKFPAEKVLVTDFLPDSVRADSFSAESLLQWQLASLAPFQDTTLIANVKLAPQMPEGTNLLINRIEATAQNEAADKLANNTTVDTVFNYVEPVLIDVSVVATVTTDSMVVQGTEFVYFARRGETYSYFIQVKNENKFPAENVVVLDFLPDSVRNETSMGRDTLEWRLGTLSPFADTTLTFDVTVASNMPEGLNPLINKVTISAFDEEPEFLANNSDIDTVFNYVEPRITDVAIESYVKTDSFAIQGADTLWYVKAGESYTYFFTIRNLGKFTATNVQFQDIVPDSVVIENFTSRDTLKSSLGILPPFSEKSLKLNATVTFHLSSNIMQLTNTALVKADNEDPEKLFNNLTIDEVFTLPPKQGCDLFALNLNVFQPAKHERLEIHFELNSSRLVSLDVYDISGYHLKNLIETTFNTGANRFEWDGSAENGQDVGSGVYIITLRSGDLICWKKVILVR